MVISKFSLYIRPNYTARKTKILQYGGYQTADDECGICLETLTAAVILPCTHKFCANCLNGWKSKFGNDNHNQERSKSCPLCRKKIPPSKEMLIQLKFHRTQKLKMEADGDTSSNYYIRNSIIIKELEKEIGDYDGKGLDYDDDECIELPKYIYDAVMTNNINRILDWLGSPVDMKRLNARYLHNALDAVGCNTLFGAIHRRFKRTSMLLEWGAEMILPRDVLHTLKKRFGSDITDRDAFIQYLIKFGDMQLIKLISPEFGGRRCEVINLPNHPQLNDKTCVVEKFITKKDKYKIIFEGLGNAALVGPNNLKRRDRTPLDCGYYISFKNGVMSRREFATKEECQEYVSSLGGGDVKEAAEELASLKV